MTFETADTLQDFATPEGIALPKAAFPGRPTASPLSVGWHTQSQTAQGGLSTSFLLVVTLLVMATGGFFWNQYQKAEKRTAEIERQNRVAASVYHAIERYADAPGILTDHEARVAIDLASDERLTENRQALLANFYRSAKRCHLGGKYSGSAGDCRKMAYNRFSATTAATSADLDTDY